MEFQSDLKENLGHDCSLKKHQEDIADLLRDLRGQFRICVDCKLPEFRNCVRLEIQIFPLSVLLPGRLFAQHMLLKEEKGMEGSVRSSENCVNKSLEALFTFTRVSKEFVVCGIHQKKE